MLTLTSNNVSQATASPTTVAATQSAFLAASAAAASRPLTPVAVSAAGAALGYSPQVPERRSGTTARANQPAAQSPAPQSSRPSIIPDPEFWRLPDRQASEQIAPLPARQQLIDSVQQAAQYVAQSAAQEAPIAQERSNSNQQAAASKARLNALLAKKPGVGDSSGHGAYTIAATRTMQMSLPSTVEAFV